MLTSLLSCAALLVQFAASETVVLEKLRVPAVAGVFYPEQPEQLRKTVNDFFAKTNMPLAPTRQMACIAPNAAYGISGETAAFAFAGLERGQYDRVIILSGAHRTKISGASIPMVQAFVTPLGIIELDPDGVQELGYSPQVKQDKVDYSKRNKRHKRLHEDEYGIEVLLPFLQERLGYFRLVPVVVGSFNDTAPGLGSRAADELAARIGKLMDARTLLVVSTNLTHYGEEFAFTPFPENTQQQIEALDNEIAEYILAQDGAGLLNFLDKNNVPIDGANALYLALKALPPGLIGARHAYTTSARKLPQSGNSVSYAAITFRHPADPPPAPRPPEPAPGALAEPVTPSP